jgi:ligand-binding sensor domain-containing protein
MLRCVLFLGLLFVSKTTISQTNPVWEIFNMSNSQIPDNTIRCLQTDSLGNLWVGTDNGLAYYNNGSWQVFTETNSGLADNYVRAVTVDTNNALWVGTTLGGVQKFDGTTWTTYNTTNSGIADNFIRTITIDKNNHKWIGTVEGLVYFDDVNWTTWQMSNSPILTNNIASIAVGPNNEKYIGTINGGAIYMNSDTTFEGIYTILNSGIPDNSQLKVKVDILGKPWFAGSAGGLFTDTGNQTWMAFNHNTAGLPTNSLTTMELDNTFNFYLGTQQCGLIVRHFDQTWAYYTMQNSELPENYILSLAKDKEGNIWIGTFSSGLVRLNEYELSLQQQGESDQLAVFPNPAISSQTIWFNRELHSPEVVLYSSDGKWIAGETFDGNVESFQLPLIPKGSYFLKIEEKNRISTTRIIISN